MGVETPLAALDVDEFSFVENMREIRSFTEAFSTGFPSTVGVEVPLTAFPFCVAAAAVDGLEPVVVVVVAVSCWERPDLTEEGFEPVSEEGFDLWKGMVCCDGTELG